MQSQQPAVGELFADRYYIEKVLGEGGMGQVYLAHDSLLEGTPVALKIISPQITRDANYLKKFLREIQLARQVTHPNVARTYEAGTFQNQLFFVMELVAGGELGNLLGRGGMPLAQALPIIIQICDGLIAIHEVGVVHGDLKPANLMLTTDGKVKITDFGVARSSESYKSGEEVIGSPRYMAPELWRGQNNSQRSDLYALGIILFEIITGRSPYEDENDTNAMYVHLATEPLRPIEANPTVPEWLDKLITDLLNKDDRRRPNSVKAVREIIEQAVKSSPQGAPQTSVANQNKEADSTAESPKSTLSDKKGGKIHPAADNFEQSLIYNEQEDAQAISLFSWIASLSYRQWFGCLQRSLEGIAMTLTLSWVLLNPVTGLHESALTMAERSDSAAAAVMATLFVLSGVAALQSAPLLLLGRAFLSRVQTIFLWASGTIATTFFLSILCLLHLRIYSHLVDPNGITAFSQRAAHSMRNVVAGSLQLTLLVPFNGLNSLAVQAGFVEPSFKSLGLSLLFIVASITFYSLFGMLIQLVLLGSRGKSFKHWALSLPLVLTGMIVAESSIAGLFSLEKMNRLTLPWIATIQQTFPRPMVFLALLNWSALYLYILLAVRPTKDEPVPRPKSSLTSP